ncbi:hypothetical protein AB6809_29305 [Paraburkholderia sp. RCC_158]|uniref:hypothetical protein n=1 Tax=Paraburkholderia sp. RCC_158 TaxID=3239220 RepID=UPI003523615F
MASDTKNVKMGICSVFYKGKDLGYTQGGVTVAVTTNTHKTNVDQFGQTTVNETIMSRDVSVKTPLAETTLDNLVTTMPGASLVGSGGAAATGKITVSALPVDGDTLTVNGKVFTFKTAASASNEILIAGTNAAQASAIAAALAASIDPALTVAHYAASGSDVNVSYLTNSVTGNTFSLAVSVPADFTLSGATLAGGVDSTAKAIVTTGVGTSLLDLAGELRLHPIGKAANDYSEDFVIPLAATAGAMNYTYDVQKERIFDVTFTGYPDPATKQLFGIGGAPA